MKPLIRWAGSKQRVLPQLRKLYPPKGSYRRFFDLTFGCGAVFADLAAQGHFESLVECYLSDACKPLMHMYMDLKHNHDLLYKLVTMLPVNKNVYDGIRESSDITPPLFLYLNKYGFNGLWRVNKSGEFNVPWGNRPEATFDYDRFEAWSILLRAAYLGCFTIEDRLSSWDDGEAFVYIDPPYPDSFDMYTPDRFDHELLLTLLKRASTRWPIPKIMLSIGNAPFTQERYIPELQAVGFTVHEILAKRSIAADGTKRGVVKEYALINYQPGE